MVTRKTKETELVAATDTHSTPPPPDPAEDQSVAEYEAPDGATYQLTAKEAEQRGFKAVGKPQNKAVKPQDK